MAPDAGIRTLPGVSQRFRWSRGRGRWVFERGGEIPPNQLRLIHDYDAGQASIARRAASSREDRSETTGAAAVATITTRLDHSRLDPPESSRRREGDSARSYSRPTAGSSGQGTQHDRRSSLTWNPLTGSSREPAERLRARGLARVDAQDEDCGGSSRDGNDEGNDDDDNDEEDEEDDDVPANIYQDYTRSSEPYRDFQVIEVRLTARPPNTDLSAAGYAGAQGIRRFAIVEAATQQTQAFIACPIKTYNGQGVSAQGVIKAHHAVIYTLPERPPAPYGSREEQPQRTPDGGTESGMQTQPILVRPYVTTRPLDEWSRLDFSTRTPFRINVDQIRLYGKVHERSLAALDLQYRAVWAQITRNTGYAPSIAASRQVAPGPSTAEPEQRRRQQAEGARDRSAAQSGPVTTSRDVATAASGSRATTRQPARGRSTQLGSSGDLTAEPARSAEGQYLVSGAPQPRDPGLARIGPSRADSYQRPEAARRPSVAGERGRNDAFDPPPATTRADNRAGPPPSSSARPPPAPNPRTTSLLPRGRASDDGRDPVRPTGATQLGTSARGPDPQRSGPSTGERTSRAERSPERQTAPSVAGRMSYEQMQATLNDLDSRAQNLGVQLPGRLTEAQIMTLAQDAQLRHRWLAQIRANWDEEMRRRPSRG
ncbi:hypothetical protein LTR53_005363 [Teratosphaeriaceae sp. CCFEE 6253]|nr:hypothetical protein LTR53_005363 [Teratosphaeriaceae sp. CCFEE 6253]